MAEIKLTLLHIVLEVSERTLLFIKSYVLAHYAHLCAYPPVIYSPHMCHFPVTLPEAVTCHTYQWPLPPGALLASLCSGPPFPGLGACVHACSGLRCDS